MTFYYTEGSAETIIADVRDMVGMQNTDDLTTSQILSWLNQVYIQDICGSIEMPELDATETKAATASQAYITFAATDILFDKSISTATDGIPLKRSSANDFTMMAARSGETTGTPTHYYRGATTASSSTERAPDIEAGAWTVGAGWESPFVGPGLIKNAAGAGTCAPTVAMTISAGTVYKVIITVAALSAGTATYTLGGTAGGGTISAAGTYVDEVYTTTSAGLIITPITTARFTISAISVKAISAESATTLQTFNLYPTPSAADSLILNYQRRPNVLTSTSRLEIDSLWQQPLTTLTAARAAKRLRMWDDAKNLYELGWNEARSLAKALYKGSDQWRPVRGPSLTSSMR